MSVYRFQVLKDGEGIWAAEDFSYKSLAKRVVRTVLYAAIRRWFS